MSKKESKTKNQENEIQDESSIATSEKEDPVISENDLELNLDYELDVEEPQEERDPTEVIEGLKTQLNEKEKALKEMEDKWLRTYADFTNFRRRKGEEIQTIRKTATKKLIMKLLGVMDSFELALQNIQGSTDERIAEGIKLIYQQFKDILSAEGIKVIECLNQPFDPNQHEAAKTIESVDHDEGIIIEVIQKGYSMNGKMIRTPLVGVSRQPEKIQTKNSTKLDEKDTVTTTETN
ncbi:MAG: nucleotide exchange factor GrpE [Promethearchaeota archaeon]